MGRFRDAWRALTRTSSSTPRSTRSYHAVSADHALDWRTSRADAVSEVRAGLVPLVARSRDLVRNSAYARRILDAMVNALVATGIRPTIKTGNLDLDNEVYRLWDTWGRVCVPGSHLTIYGLQAMLARAWFQDGEALLRFRPRLTADLPGLPPLKLQPLEADLLEPDRDAVVGLNRIVSGIEFDAIGELAAYHLLREHPGNSYPFASASSLDTVRVPASSIIHLFRPERPGQVRGTPLLSPVILALWDLAGYSEAILTGTRAAASIVATVEGGDEEDPPSGLVAQGEDSVETPDPVTDSMGRVVEQLGANTVIYSPPGKKVSVHAPQPPQGVAEYVTACLHEIAAGVGMSYHVLSGDMSDSSFAQAKLGLLEQARNIAVLRSSVFVPVALDPIWRAFIDASILAGLLPDNPALYAVRWSDPKVQAADRLEEAKAAKLEMRLALRSRPEIIEADGRDPDDVDREIADDKRRRAELGIVSDGDPSETSEAGQVNDPIPTP